MFVFFIFALVLQYSYGILNNDSSCEFHLVQLRIIPNKNMICGTFQYSGPPINHRYFVENSTIALRMRTTNSLLDVNLSNKICYEQNFIFKMIPKSSISLCDTLEPHLSYENFEFQEFVAHTIKIANATSTESASQKLQCPLKYNTSLIQTKNVKHDPCVSEQGCRFCRQHCSSLSMGEGGIFSCADSHTKLIENSVTMTTGSKLYYIHSFGAFCFPISASFSSDIGTTSEGIRKITLLSGKVPITIKLKHNRTDRPIQKIKTTVIDNPESKCLSFGTMTENQITKTYMCAWLQTDMEKPKWNKLYEINDHTIKFETTTIDGYPVKSTSKISAEGVHRKNALQRDRIYDTCPQGCNDCRVSCNVWLRGRGAYVCNKKMMENWSEAIGDEGVITTTAPYNESSGSGSEEEDLYGIGNSTQNVQSNGEIQHYPISCWYSMCHIVIFVFLVIIVLSWRNPYVPHKLCLKELIHMFCH